MREVSRDYAKTPLMRAVDRYIDGLVNRHETPALTGRSDREGFWWHEEAAARAHATLVNFRDRLGDRNMRRLTFWQNEATRTAEIARALRFAEIDRNAAWSRARG